MKITGSSGDLSVKFQVLCISFHENLLLIGPAPFTGT